MSLFYITEKERQAGLNAIDECAKHGYKKHGFESFMTFPDDKIESRIHALQDAYMDDPENLTDEEWHEMERLATIAAELNKSEAHHRIAECLENINVPVVLDFPHHIWSKVASSLEICFDAFCLAYFRDY